MTLPAVIFLGPCYKCDRRTGGLHEPFSPQARSGAFLRRIAAPLADKFEVCFDNIIADAVWDGCGRERVPAPSELIVALQDHRIWSMHPSSTVAGLGGAVGRALKLVAASRRAKGVTEMPGFLFFEHPSFVLRRPACERSAYGQRILGALCGAGGARECGCEGENGAGRD
jgi:hypothetical protein